MYAEEFKAVAGAAGAKADLLKNNKMGYFLSSMLGGVYIGFGVLLSFTVGGLLNGQPYAKIIMGFSFGVALSLVVIAGAELFTGNNLVMAAGMLQHTVSPLQTAKVWAVCYVGNWIGAILLAVLFWQGGFATGDVGEFIAASAATKMSVPAGALFIRGMLCNILVCLAVWCGYRCKSESGKLMMIFWCLFAFIITGFEHSVANMTLLTISLLSPQTAAVSLSGYFYNILIVTLGNMAGGICCVALPYYLISRNTGKKK